MAASDIVAVGTLDVPKKKLTAEARTERRNRRYVNIPLQIEHVLKGQWTGADAAIRFYPDSFRDPSVDWIIGSSERKSIVFLFEFDSNPPDLYFAIHDIAALQPVTDTSLSKVKAEIDRQAQLLRHWRVMSDLPHFDRVKTLIASLRAIRADVIGRDAAIKTQQSIFSSLEKLGTAAVPAIVMQMNDFRPLPVSYIKLQNNFGRPGFEAYRQYSPDAVVDALSALLNQITGHDFGYIANGASRGKRQAAVNGWRVYASEQICGKLKPSPPSK